jgi:Rap1a immunity proteins
MKMMMRLMLLLAAMPALGAVAEPQLPHTVPPGTHDTNGFVKGTQLLDRCQSETVVNKTFCLSYIVGVADAIGLTQAMQHENITGTPVWRQTAVCFPENVQGPQVRDIVVKFLVAYPERRGDPAAELVLVALVRAWGCPAK